MFHDQGPSTYLIAYCMEKLVFKFHLNFFNLVAAGLCFQLPLHYRGRHSDTISSSTLVCCRINLIYHWFSNYHLQNIYFFDRYIQNQTDTNWYICVIRYIPYYLKNVICVSTCIPNHYLICSLWQTCPSCMYLSVCFERP
jgi:hypothetical protein